MGSFQSMWETDHNGGQKWIVRTEKRKWDVAYGGTMSDGVYDIGQ